MEMTGKHRDSKQLNNYNKICDKCMDNTIKLYIMTMSVLILSFFGVVIGTCYGYIKDGKLATVFEVRLPILNQNPQTEYIVNLIWQSIAMLIALLGLFVIEETTALINNAITVTSMLSAQELADLSDSLENDAITKDYCNWKLKHIFMKIVYMDG